jgi:hypothetical protein
MKHCIHNFIKCIGWATLFCLAIPALAQNASRSRVPANLTTGPEIGEQIPLIEAADQHGVRRDFDDIVGPAGAMILFFRSADW